MQSLAAACDGGRVGVDWTCPAYADLRIGQDSVSRKQVADQELTRQNKALAVSRDRRLPVRVVRGATHRSPFSPLKGYRYDGLYTVENCWHEKGPAGFYAEAAHIRPLGRPHNGPDTKDNLICCVRIIITSSTWVHSESMLI